MAKILLIDDEAGMRRIMANILAPAGHTVLAAEDGAGGVDLCRRERPDIVFADSDLPDLHGVEILAALKKINPRLPVVMLTGISERDAADELAGAGAAAHLSKPFKINEFIQLVDKILPPSAPARAPSPVTPPPAAIDGQPSVLRKKGTRAVVMAAALLVSACLGFLAYRTIASRPQKPAEYGIEAGNPSGIWHDGNAVWVSDWVSGTLFRYQFGDKASVVSSKIDGVEPSGITGTGKTVWVSNAFGKKILKYTAKGKTLARVGAYPSPGSSPCGLWHDGRNLWSLDYQEGMLYKHELDAALTVITVAATPAKNPCGMVKIGSDFYVADTATNRIYVISADRFSIQGVYEWPGGGTLSYKISSIGWDGRRLWACFDGQPKLYSCRLKDLKKIRA